MSVSTAPTLGVSFGTAISLGFSKYFTFTGRASRSQYWYLVLFNIICAFVASFIDALVGVGLLSAVSFLAFFFPLLSTLVRRLHDTGRSGWWYLLVLTIIGALVILIWTITEGDPGENKYGAGPVTAAPLPA